MRPTQARKCFDGIGSCTHHGVTRAHYNIQRAIVNGEPDGEPDGLVKSGLTQHCLQLSTLHFSTCDRHRLASVQLHTKRRIHSFPILSPYSHLQLKNFFTPFTHLQHHYEYVSAFKPRHYLFQP